MISASEQVIFVAVPARETRLLEITPQDLLAGFPVKKKKENKPPVHLVEKDSKGRETRVTDIDPGNKTIVKEFYANGLAKSELTMHIRNMHALTTLWEETGRKAATRQHLCGQRTGLWQQFGENGQVVVNEVYVDDKLQGERWYIDEDGEKIVEQYDRGQKIEKPVPKLA